MNYDIDVHIIRPYVFDDRHIRWLDQCVASLENEPVNLHFPYYVDGDIRAARFAGFSSGTGKYVSFVDIDDWVEPGIFKSCADQLDQNPHACGVFTRSKQVWERPSGPVYTDLAPYKPWPLPENGSLVDIHQLVVMNRQDCLRVYHTQYDLIPPQIHEMPWVYWEMAKVKPWIALNAIGYYWRIREDGAHRIYNKEIAESLQLSMRHMNEIRQQLLIKQSGRSEQQQFQPRNRPLPYR